MRAQEMTWLVTHHGKKRETSTNQRPTALCVNCRLAVIEISSDLRLLSIITNLAYSNFLTPYWWEALMSWAEPNQKTVVQCTRPVPSPIAPPGYLYAN